MTKYAPGYYYRIIARNKTIDLVITQLVNMVKEFKDSDEMRLAALTAFRSLIDLISYREIYQTMEISDWQSLVIKLIMQDLQVQNDIHGSLAAILITYQFRVSAKREFRNISRRDAALRLVFLVQFYMVIIDHICLNQCSNVFQRVGKKLHGREP